MKKRFTEEQIIGFLREAEAGIPVAELPPARILHRLLVGLNCHSCSCASMAAVGQKLTSSTQPQIGHTAR